MNHHITNPTEGTDQRPQQELGARRVELQVSEAELADVDVSQIDALRALTPTERLLRHEGALELVEELRRAGREFYGFDPRAIIEAARSAS
jgi:hypothetical protein